MCWSSSITKRFPAAVRSTMYILIASVDRAGPCRQYYIRTVIQLLLPLLLVLRYQMLSSSVCHLGSLSADLVHHLNYRLVP